MAGTTNNIFDRSGFIDKTAAIDYINEFIDINQELYPVITKDKLKIYNHGNQVVIKIKDVYNDFLNKVYVKQVRTFIDILNDHRKEYKKEYSYIYSKEMFEAFLIDFFKLNNIDEYNVFRPKEYTLFVINDKSITYENETIKIKKYIKSKTSFNKALHKTFSTLNQKYKLLKENEELISFNKNNFFDKVVFKSGSSRILINESKQSILMSYSKFFEMLIDLIIYNPFYITEHEYFVGSISVFNTLDKISRWYRKNEKLKIETDLENIKSYNEINNYNDEEFKFAIKIIESAKGDYYYLSITDFNLMQFDIDIQFDIVNEDYQINKVIQEMNIPNLITMFNLYKTTQNKLFKKLEELIKLHNIKVKYKKIVKLNNLINAHIKKHENFELINRNFNQQLVNEDHAEFLQETNKIISALCHNVILNNRKFLKTLLSNDHNNNKFINKLIRL